MSKAISVVVIGRSLNQQERTRLRSSSHTPLAILAEFPVTPQVLEELNRLRPQAALVLLNGELDYSFELIERIHQELPETSVICSSADNSSDVILQSFRSGAMEFLKQPMVESEIAAVFAKIEQASARPEESPYGRVIAVYASKGGCGTTFVTANLAASLAKLIRKRACIVDLNFQAGDQPLYLGLEPQYSIYDLVRNFDRLDEQLLTSYLTQRSKQLSLLAAPTEIGKGEDVKVEHVMRAIALLRVQADYVVIDPPRAFNEITISALDLADDLILLLTLDIPAIRSAKRTFDIFTRLGYDRSRIKVVINRYTKTPEFDIKQVERVLETQVFATISNDYQAAIASINVGEPLVLSKNQSRILQDFSSLVGKLTGIRQQNESLTRRRPARSGWASLFGGKR
ncbi:MAG TPA: AAA family ATPase [Blastocatellia bacterium]|nr:AAA family ATPase [Blastocatellia bacterium]